MSRGEPSLARRGGRNVRISRNGMVCPLLYYATRQRVPRIPLLLPVKSEGSMTNRCRGHSRPGQNKHPVLEHYIMVTRGDRPVTIMTGEYGVRYDDGLPGLKCERCECIQ